MQIVRGCASHPIRPDLHIYKMPSSFIFRGGGFFQLRFFILDIFPCSQFIPDHFVPSHSLTELSKLCGGQMVREASRCLFFGARLLSLDHLFSAGLPGQKE